MFDFNDETITSEQEMAHKVSECVPAVQGGGSYVMGGVLGAGTEGGGENSSNISANDNVNHDNANHPDSAGGVERVSSA
jgi:hypothetical protein